MAVVGGGAVASVAGLPATGVGFASLPFMDAPAALAGVLAAAAFAAFGWLGVQLILADTRTRRLPNRMLLRVAVGIVAPLVVAGWAAGETARLAVTVAVALVVAALTLGTWAFAPGVLGGGDVKLIPMAAYVAVCAVPVARTVQAIAAFGLTLLAGFAVSAVAARIRRRSTAAGAPTIVGAALAGAWAGTVTVPGADAW